MNVLVILVDPKQTGMTSGAVERLAARGTRFVEAYACEARPWQQRLQAAGVVHAEVSLEEVTPDEAATWIERRATEGPWSLCVDATGLDAQRFDHALTALLDRLDSDQASATTQVILVGAARRSARGFERMALIVSGPDVPSSHVCATPVSAADLYRTVLYAARLPLSTAEAETPMRSLQGIANEPDDRARIIMDSRFEWLKAGRFVVHRAPLGAELFDLQTDPDRTRNLAEQATMQPIVEHLIAGMDAARDAALPCTAIPHRIA